MNLISISIQSLRQNLVVFNYLINDRCSWTGRQNHAALIMWSFFLNPPPKPQADRARVVLGGSSSLGRALVQKVKVFSVLAWWAGVPSGTHSFHILCWVFARIAQYHKRSNQNWKLKQSVQWPREYLLILLIHKKYFCIFGQEEQHYHRLFKLMLQTCLQKVSSLNIQQLRSTSRIHLEPCSCPPHDLKSNLHCPVSCAFVSSTPWGKHLAP